MELALKHVPSNVTFTSPDIIELQTKNDQLAEENKALKAELESAQESNIVRQNKIYVLKATQAVLVEAMGMASSVINKAEYDLEASVYTLEDDEMGSIFFARDLLDKALSEVTDTIPKRDNV